MGGGGGERTADEKLFGSDPERGESILLRGVRQRLAS